MSTETFSNELVNGLTVTNGTITETDTGSVDPFVGISPISFGTYTAGAYSGIRWSGFNAGAVAPGATVALDFQYTVTDTNPGLLITSLQDTFNGSGSAGTTLTMTENVYSDAAHTNLIGTLHLNLTDTADPPYELTDTPLSTGYQTVYVDLQVNAAVSSTAASGSQVTFSILNQGFAQSGITVDKQISVDGGSTWIETGDDVLQNPTVLAGTKVLERVSVVNTGTNAITGASVSDTGTGPANFVFAGNPSFNLGVGGSITSDVATVVAGSGYQSDEASATGTVTIASTPVTIGATDVGDFTGATPSITIDKQISVNGGGWIDVGNDMTDPLVLAGATITEQVIVVNTGSVGISGASIGDVGAGPGSFTVGGNATFTLAAGQTVTSNVATVIAGSGGYQSDTATVTGTASDAYGDTQSVSANDSANFTGATPSITIDKQISVNGGGWIDVGNDMTDPLVLAGATITEQVIVVNTGSVGISGASIGDVGTGPGSFTVGGNATFTLAAGQTVTSNVATVIAGSGGYQSDTATVTGTASDAYGDTQSVSANDSANFTGATPSITIDKQISVNGGGWIDVGNDMTDPLVLAGATITEQVIVVNTGSVGISGASIGDVGAGPGSFTVGGNATFTLAAGQTVTSNVATVIAGSGGYQSDTATVTGTASDAYGDTQSVSANDSANFTGTTPAITIDKQISVNGGGWIDVGNDMTDPLVLAGATITEQVIVVNSGSVGISGASIGDVGAGPGSFTVGGNATFTLAAGQTVTSNVATVIAGSGGYQSDTATVTGTASDAYGDTQSVSANDSANFTGATPSITIDKQISVNGGGWIDVGNDMTDPLVLAGATITEQVIVVNTGSVGISGASIGDVGAGPGSFTVGGNATFTLAAGQTVTSNVATVIAGSGGYQSDTATVTGTASDAYGDTQSVSANDSANFTGATPSITIDKQISVNGGGWIDVGNDMTDPLVLAGATITEQVIVVNSGSVGISGASIGDVGAGPGSFTVGGSATFSLGAGAGTISDTATVVAGTGAQSDTATLTGTAYDSYGDTQSVSANDSANFTGETYGISIDKQISTDGVNWLDVGNGNIAQDPTVAAGSSVYERVVLINTGAVDITNASVSDADSDGLAGFTFGSASTTGIAASGTATSDIATITAGSVYSLDTATVTGSVSDSYGDTGSVSASDIANYTGSVIVPTGSITVDKQISVNGCTWLDVGNGNLSQDPTVLAGMTLYERVIVVNDTSTTLNNGQVTDAGSGVSGFTFGGGWHNPPSSSFTLGAGQTIVSNVGSFVAGSGTQYDTATATGTITVGGTNTTETGQDTAGYVGTQGSITVDKQISVNGCTWLDVGNGNLSQDPSVLAGTMLYERVIVVNDTSATLNNGQVTDAGSGPAGFTFGSGGWCGSPSSTFTLGAGQTIVSNVASFVAGIGTQYDTATATGTITVGGGSTTETGQDTAGYVGTQGSITVDKQISVDGCTWVDVGNGNLSQDPNVLTGTALYERVIVVNDTGSTLNNGHVVDAGSGPSSFTFGSGGYCSPPSSTFTLGAGQTIVSNVASFVAGIGTQYDTATAVGTITVGGSHTTETAQDTAGYVGTLGSITVDKQISVNGCTWLDVGNGNLANSPTVAAGSTLYERVIVVNDTNAMLNSGTVVDAGSGPSGFTFGGSSWCSSPSSTFSLGAGQTIISNVASFTATTGQQFDTVTATGTVTAGGSSTSLSAQDDASYAGTVVSNGKITGTVWTDSDDDGCMDGCENGRSGVQVQLLNNAGSIVASATTNGNGSYSFGSLAGGTYNVEFTAPNGKAFSPPGGDSDAGPGGVTSAITITGTQTASNVNAGLVSLPSTSTNLYSAYGKASQIEFTYQPGNTVSPSMLQSGLASVSGSNSNSMAFVAVSNNSNPFASGASIYFSGSIATGQDFLTQVAASSSGSKTYIDVYASQAAFNAHQAPVQTDTYVTGGSQSMHLNDTIGSVKVAGYVGHNGGFLT